MLDRLGHLFFSLSGSIDRATWALASASIATFGTLITWLVNNDAYDESAHVITNAPTMAAFLTAVATAFVLAVLCKKRLEALDRGAGLALVALTLLLGLVCGWGVGFFTSPWDIGRAESLGFWAMLAALGLIGGVCARADPTGEA